MSEAERIARLEERLAWFERHVIEQDKAMLELVGEVDRLRKEVELTRLRASVREPDAGASPADDRPPHY